MITFDQIRDRIEPLRGDKKPREAQLSFQIGARRLASETYGLEEIVLFTLPAGAFRVEPYRYASAIVTDDGYQITIDPATWQSTDNPFQKETVLVVKADYQTASGSWNGLHGYNEQLMFKHHHHVEPASGSSLRAYASDRGQFRPNRPMLIDTQIRAVVAYQPVGDFTGVEFSHEYEDALVEGALASYLRLPGKDMDRREAAECEARFLSMASALRGMSLIGAQGYARGSTHPRHGKRWSRFMSQDVLDY